MSTRVAFIGKAGSGKTTLAQEIQKRITASQGPTRILSFATPIKELVSDIGLEPESEEYRRACQVIGQYLRDEVDSSWWVDILDQKINGNVIVDDVRYYNEAEMLSYNDFFFVYLDVPDEVRLERRPDLADEGIINHPSESEIDSFKREFTHLRLIHPFTVEDAVERIIDGVQTFTGNW